MELGEGEPCPVCHEPFEAQTVLFSKQEVTFRRCPTCRTELINPRPSASWLTSHYERLGRRYFLDPDKLLSDFHAERYCVEQVLLEGLGGRLIDVGCSTGSFVKVAQDQGFEASGIDIDGPAVEFGRRELGLPLQQGDVTAGRIPGEGFDVVTLWATLEHLAQPGPFLDECARLLRPCGAMLLTVPNGRAMTCRLLGRRNRGVCVEHLNYFTADNLSRLLRDHGFEVDLVMTRKINPKTILQDAFNRQGAPRTTDQMVSDQKVTDVLKYGRAAAPFRWLHGGVERGLGRVGLGDLLMIRALKRAS
ncbi:MAG: class I SAM-dependent methyltransferase [Acidimicrobiales bacterium]